MKLLLCKNVESLGIVGDVVDVATGYARNYLVPQGLATEPTVGNMRRLAEARRAAEREQSAERGRIEALCEKLEGVEVTIHAKANEDGHLYGSVGTKDIADALQAEGFFVEPDWVLLDAPIRHLDNLAVDIRLAADLRGTVKVWVVREKAEGEPDDEETEESATTTGTEAGMDDESAGD